VPNHFFFFFLFLFFYHRLRLRNSTYCTYCTHPTTDNRRPLPPFLPSSRRSAETNTPQCLTPNTKHQTSNAHYHTPISFLISHHLTLSLSQIFMFQFQGLRVMMISIFVPIKSLLPNQNKQPSITFLLHGASACQIVRSKWTTIRNKFIHGLNTRLL
jgi:hypothetical protein